MRNFYSFRAFLLAAIVSLTGGTALAQTQVTDVLTAADFPATNTTYTAFSGVSKSSGAVYAGQSAKSNAGAIQMRSNNSNSGIVSTTSGGKVKSVKITVASGENTIEVYGSNTAYTSASELYATGETANQGTKLGSLNATGTISVDGDYAYVGIRSNRGAIYLTSVEITWEQEGGTGDNRSDAVLSFWQQSYVFDQGSEDAMNFAGQEAELCDETGMPIEGDIEYSVTATPAEMISWSQGSYVMLNETVAGTATVTATFAGDNNYKPATASYTITIQAVVPDIATFNALADKSKAKLTLTDAEVVYANGNDIFVRDESGATDFFRTDLGYNTGDILNGTLTATHEVYNNMNELTKPENVNVAVEASGTEPEAREATVETAQEYTCDLITLNKVYVALVGNYFYAYADVPDNAMNAPRVQVYDKFNLNYTLQDGKWYNLKGILILFKTTYEICPIEAPQIVIEAPVITPDAGEISAGAEVTIAAADEDADLAIYYTLDGTDPAGQAGVEYTEPIVLTKAGEVTVKAVAVDEDGNVSEQAEVTYTVVANLEEPAIEPVGGLVYTATPITLSVEDETLALYYTTDGTTPDPNATPIVGTLYEEPFTLEAGERTLTVVAVDAYGNVGEPATAVFFVEEQKEAGIAWEQEAVEQVPNGEMVANTFVNPNGLEVTFSSSDPEIARVDDFGFVFAGTKEGTATITATFEGTEEYMAAEASFTLTLAWPVAPALDAPVIYPDGGEISENASIEVSWNGVGGGAYIIYTTDGTDPKESQTAVKRLGGVNITVAEVITEDQETLEVKAYAVGIPQMDTEGESEVVSATFTIIRSTQPQPGEEVEVEVPAEFGYTTLYYAEKNLVVPEDVKVYTITIDEEGYMTPGYEYEPGDVIVARTGVVIQGNGVADAVRSRVNRAGEEETVEVFKFQLTDDDSYDPSAMVENYLLGSEEEAMTVGDDPDTDYYFYKLKEDEVTLHKGFFWEAEEGGAFLNEANRAYLAVPKTEAEQIKGFTFEGEKVSALTGVGALEAIAGKAQPAYDLQGRRVAQPAKGGIYIVNGRKVLK